MIVERSSFAVGGKGFLTRMDKPRPARPSYRRAIWAGLRDSEDGLSSLSAIVLSVLALLFVTYSVGPTFVPYAFFMSGVCGVLAITQRAQIDHFNQKLIWLGASKPLLPVRKDRVARIADRLQLATQVAALAAIIRGWWL